MIRDMDHSAAYLDHPDEEASIWPWVVGLLAFTGVALITVQLSQSIPSAVASSARNAIAKQGISGLNVAVDGRDITLSGTISEDTNKRELLAAVEEAAGVRAVTDNLTVFNPRADAQRRAIAFQTQLSRIDVGSLAFEPSSSSLTVASEQAMNALTELLLQYPEQRIRIAGHTDNTGRPAVNLRISRERADSVARYLISRGVLESQLLARGFGASRPVADNSTESGRASNRRIEILYIQ
jgi:outer membrane protein OmpA-like peptidoglycan-associated protein